MQQKIGHWHCTKYKNRQNRQLRQLVGQIFLSTCGHIGHWRMYRQRLAGYCLIARCVPAMGLPSAFMPRTRFTTCLRHSHKSKNRPNRQLRQLRPFRQLPHMRIYGENGENTPDISGRFPSFTPMQPQKSAESATHTIGHIGHRLCAPLSLWGEQREAPPSA